MSTPPSTAIESGATGRRRLSVAMSTRDLINIGIFLVLYVAVLYGVGFIGFLNPIMMFVSLAMTALVGGIVMQLFFTRIRHAGMVFVLLMVLALILVPSGNPWQAIFAVIPAALAAELILFLGGYRSKTAALWAYPALTLWYIGPFLPIFWDADGYREYLTESTNAEYADGVMDLFTPAFGVGFMAVVFVSALVGSFVGQALLRKHFERAGIA